MSDNIVFAANQRVAGERKIGRGPRDAAAGNHRHFLWTVSANYINHSGTAAETTVSTASIAGDEIAFGDSIAMHFTGMLYNGTGANQTLRIRVTADAASGTDSVILDHTSVALASSVTKFRALKLDLVMNEQNSGDYANRYFSSSAHWLIGDVDTASQYGSVAASGIADQALQHANIVTFVPSTKTTLNLLLTLSSAVALQMFVQGAVSYHKV